MQKLNSAHDSPTSLKELAASLDCWLVAGSDLIPNGYRKKPPCHEWLLPLVALEESNKWLFTLTARFLSSWIKTWCLIRGRNLRLLKSPFDWSFLDLLDTLQVVKRFKDFCLWPITLTLKGISLPCPFRGKFKRVQSTWLRTRRSRKKLMFCQTILQLKRVSPPVPRDFVTASLEKHKSLMTGSPRQSSAFVEDVREKVRELLGGHCRLCRSVQKNHFFELLWNGVRCSCWRFDPSPLERVRDFSMRACLEQPWGRGNYAAWHNSIPRPQRLLDSNLLSPADGGVHSSSAFYFPSRVEVSPSREELSRYMVRVVPICEPLKVRVITVGPRWHSPYWAKFQRSLQRFLSGFPYVFSRKTVKAGDFSRFFSLVEEMEEKTGEEWCIVSDDASAATDSLCSDLPRILSDYVTDPYVRDEFHQTWNSWIYYPGLVARRWRPSTIEVERPDSLWDASGFFLQVGNDALCAAKSLIDVNRCTRLQLEPLLEVHGYIWGDSFLPSGKLKISLDVGGRDWFEEMKTHGFICRQTNGQLMGDRRSFPILCLLHSAVKINYLESRGITYQTWRHFAVNGDDGIIVIPRRLVEDYFNFADEFWELNRLKTYVSRNLISFNSQFFQKRGLLSKQVPIIRWNLIINNNKNGGKGHDPRVWNVVRECAPPVYEEFLFREFLKNWKDKLQECSKNGCNWFLPLSVGGAGLKTRKPFRITGRQYFAIAETRRRIGTEKGCPFQTRVRPTRTTLLNEGSEHLVLRGTKLLSKKSLGDLQVPRPGAVKSCHQDMVMHFRKLPMRYSGRVPWFDLSDLALRLKSELPSQN